MLDEEARITVLHLHKMGLTRRAISRTLRISRNTVRTIIESGQPEVPGLNRAARLETYTETIRSLHDECGGNLVRVQEELAKRKVIDIPYSTLTHFCRREGIGIRPRVPAGRYHFEPGEEMQHDTSPHVVTLGGSKRNLQCASLILCHSRLLFARVYSRWSRFECRAFLQEALQYFGGSAARCMIDNSSVVIAHGRGRDAVPAPAMQALAQRFGFRFEAHGLGHADRSGRVERPFHYIENNFYPGRSFSDLQDCNHQIRDWCDQSNLKFRRHLGATPRTVWVAEKPALKPLPVHIPEIYDIHERRVDVEGYVTLHTNRYSIPNPDVMIGRRLRVKETIARVRILDGRAILCEHEKLPTGARQRATRPEHRVVPRHRTRRDPSPEEKDLRAQHEVFGQLIARLRKRHGGRAIRATRRLYQLFQDYPTDTLVRSIQDALEYDLIDLTRIEQMVLRTIAGDYFRLPKETEDERRPGPAPGATQAPENPRDPEP